MSKPCCITYTQRNCQHEYNWRLPSSSFSSFLPSFTPDRPHRTSTMARTKKEETKVVGSSQPESRCANISISHYHSVLIHLGQGFSYMALLSVAFSFRAISNCHSLALRVHLLPDKQLESPEITVSVKWNKRRCKVSSDVVDQEFKNDLYV